MSDTWACIAALNEEETIGEIVNALRCQGFKVAVTDDGSQDMTGSKATAWGATVHRHEAPRGIAAACMAAWRTALEGGATRLVQMDAGGSHQAEEANELLAIDADVVIGSRFLPGSRYVGRRWRAALSRLAAALCSVRIGGPWIADWTSGYRALTANAAYYLLNFCTYEARMHGWQIEVLGKVLRAGLSVAEVPITYVAGPSSFDLSVAREAFQAWRRL